ncbi:MAG: hypothetical protein HZB56_05735 [Deltaproteobacteria bacterium]|nr:hypothetical protein [Deltaproteobacteria bacterium]
MRRLALPLAALILGLAASPAGAAPRLVAAFDDPAGDATGPGSYTPPGDTGFRDGDFDLRRLAVYVDGDEVLFEVTLGSTFRPPDTTRRTNQIPLELSNGITLQNVDIYLDTDRSPGSGSGACIPGRRVAFAEGATWEAAVVLTPQPQAARAIAGEAMGEAARRVHFAERLQVTGRTVTARVPAAFLGGLPTAAWGYSVQVSGAAWERSFSLADRVRGKREANAFTLPVLTTPEAFAFGGAPMGETHPRVVDLLLPPGVDQRAALGSFDAEKGTFAKVPFVYATATPTATPTATATATATPTPSLTVADVSGEMVSISGPTEGLRAWQLGRVLSEGGETVARVVVLQVHAGGAVASAVDGKEKIRKGARVSFAP